MDDTDGMKHCGEQGWHNPHEYEVTGVGPEREVRLWSCDGKPLEQDDEPSLDEAMGDIDQRRQTVKTVGMTTRTELTRMEDGEPVWEVIVARTYVVPVSSATSGEVATTFALMAAQA